MTFEEKLFDRAGLCERDNELLCTEEDCFLQGARWARQETLREVKDILETAAKFNVFPANKLLAELQKDQK